MATHEERVAEHLAKIPTNLTAEHLRVLYASAMEHMERIEADNFRVWKVCEILAIAIMTIGRQSPAALATISTEAVEIAAVIVEKLRPREEPLPHE